MVNRPSSSFHKGDNAILQKGDKKSQSFQSASLHVYLIFNKWTKILNLKHSYLDSRKISNACALGACLQHYNIYMSYEKSEPEPDIKIESYILDLYF